MRRTLHRYVVAGSLAVLSVALLGASCDKKPATEPAGPNVPFDEGGKGGATGEEAEATPKALTAEQTAQVDELVDKLRSPCGKPMSLKKSLEIDPTCQRNATARDFVGLLVGMELSGDQITQLYDDRYAGGRPEHTFDLREAPFEGTPNAPVVFVEFFDYGCPHCKEAHPHLERALAKHKGDVVVYFKHFPLGAHGGETTKLAAQAAMAAHRQGKFLAMHEMLFANQGSFAKQDLLRYARALGLDMVRFQTDLTDAAVVARVEADKAEGERAGIHGTPSLFVNGRAFSAPIALPFLSSWIQEELAVNR